jgi:hypothetical protein
LFFGQGCSLYLNRSSLSDYCDKLKARSFQMLGNDSKFLNFFLNVEKFSLCTVGSKFSRNLPERLVATFGNSLPNQTADWVKVRHRLINLI